MPWDGSAAAAYWPSFYGYTNIVTFCNSTIGSNFLNIVGGSGAPSFIYSKPSWQNGVVGIPSDGKRDLPDISLLPRTPSGNMRFCSACQIQPRADFPVTTPMEPNALINSAGGTSFTAPQFASIQALINQKAGGPQGDPDPIYYQLATDRIRKRLQTPTRLIWTNAIPHRETTWGRAVFSMMLPWAIMLFRASGRSTVTILRQSGYGILSMSDHPPKPIPRRRLGLCYRVGHRERHQPGESLAINQQDLLAPSRSPPAG